MKLLEIKHTDVHATGVDQQTRFPVIITKSISYIYKRYELDKNPSVEIHYDPVTWKNKIEMGIIEKALLGMELTAMDQLDLEKILIRFGWISKDLYQLEWVPINVLIGKYLDNELTLTEKNKFQQICRTLCIPMRVMSARRKEHQAELKAKKKTRELAEV